MKKLIIFIIAIGFNYFNPVYAETGGQGIISVVQSGDHMADPYVLLTIDPTPTLQSTCATAGETRLIFNPSTDSGKAMLSLALSANAAGRQVEYKGYGSCYTDSSQGWKWEMVNWLRIK